MEVNLLIWLDISSRENSEKGFVDVSFVNVTGSARRTSKFESIGGEGDLLFGWASILPLESDRTGEATLPDGILLGMYSTCMMSSSSSIKA